MALTPGLVLATIIGLAFCVAGDAQGNGAHWRNKYYLAAEPVGLNALKSYPASLFTVTSDHKLHLVRQFFKTGGHFSDFANDLHGTVFLAGRNGIYVVPVKDLRRAVYVPVRRFDDAFCWGAVYGVGIQAGVQFCPGQHVSLVPVQSNKNQAREQPGSWAAFKYLQFRGQNGGPFQVGPPAAQIDGTSLVLPNGVSPGVTLAQLPATDRAASKLRRQVFILASTAHYLVIWIEPAPFTAPPGAPSGASSGSLIPGIVTLPPHQSPVRVLVLNKQTYRWRTLELPTTVSTSTKVPVRLFGNWIVTTAMAWSPPAGGTGSASLGIANLQKTPMYTESSDIQAAYARRFQDIQIHGKLAIWNLSDGRQLTLRTGQEDSEVLRIAKDGTMLYRVNDAIYSARIDGKKIDETALVVKAPEVTNIHWVFGNRIVDGS